MSDDEVASRKLVRRFAAHSGEFTAEEPPASADETAQDEATRSADADGKLNESTDEDRDTVVDVETRELGRDPVLLISEYHTKEQISRARDAHEALREAVRDVRRAESNAEPQVVNTGTAVNSPVSSKPPNQLSRSYLVVRHCRLNLLGLLGSRLIGCTGVRTV